MKTTTFLLLCLCWFSANATIWRINSNPQVNANFSSINDAVAHYTVASGDTLYLENGSYFQSSTLSKTLTLIGPGYFLLENDSTYANPLPAQIESLIIHGNGCTVIGVKVIQNISISANNVLVERSQAGGFNGGGYLNVSVRDCYINGNISAQWMSSTIHNNIILGNISLTYGTSSHNIYNNVIYYNSGTYTYALAATNSTVINNIIIREPVSPDPGVNRTEYTVNFASSANTSFARNLLSQSPNASFPTNLYNQVRGDIFNLTGSTDELWILKTGSPAIGYGSNGDDCGAFGGAMPYVLSGLPWLLPRIIEANIPSTGTGNVIPVHIKAKTQEE